MAITICLAQSKGGTGKSTSTLNIGVVLARKGYRVLLVDIDQQANLTTGLGIDPLELPKTMRSLLIDLETSAEEVIVPTVEEVDLIPANLDLAFVELAMQPMARERVLTKKLAPIKSKYDFILIDTPPSFGIAVTNAMAASDYVLVPVLPEPFCIRNLPQLIENVEAVRQNVHPTMRFLGLFVTLYRPNEAAHVQYTEQLRDDWSDYMFGTIIRDSALNDRAAAESRSIVKLRPKSGLAQDYLALTEEVLARVQ